MLEVKDYSKHELADAIYPNNTKPKSRLVTGKQVKRWDGFNASLR